MTSHQKLAWLAALALGSAACGDALRVQIQQTWELTASTADGSWGDASPAPLALDRGADAELAETLRGYSGLCVEVALGASGVTLGSVESEGLSELPLGLLWSLPELPGCAAGALARCSAVLAEGDAVTLGSEHCDLDTARLACLEDHLATDAPAVTLGLTLEPLAGLAATVVLRPTIVYEMRESGDCDYGERSE